MYNYGHNYSGTINIATTYTWQQAIIRNFNKRCMQWAFTKHVIMNNNNYAGS